MIFYVPIDPPEQPTIAGYTEGRSVYAGNVQSMTCTAVGGNPPATLQWMNGSMFTLTALYDSVYAFSSTIIIIFIIIVIFNLNCHNLNCHRLNRHHLNRHSLNSDNFNIIVTI